MIWLLTGISFHKFYSGFLRTHKVFVKLSPTEMTQRVSSLPCLLYSAGHWKIVTICLTHIFVDNVLNLVPRWDVSYVSSNGEIMNWCWNFAPKLRSNLSPMILMLVTMCPMICRWATIHLHQPFMLSIRTGSSGRNSPAPVNSVASISKLSHTAWRT